MMINARSIEFQSKMRVVFDKKIRMVENGQGFTLYRIDGCLSEP